MAEMMSWLWDHRNWISASPEAASAIKLIGSRDMNQGSFPFGIDNIAKEPPEYLHLFLVVRYINSQVKEKRDTAACFFPDNDAAWTISIVTSNWDISSIQTELVVLEKSVLGQIR